MENEVKVENGSTKADTEKPEKTNGSVEKDEKKENSKRENNNKNGKSVKKEKDKEKVEETDKTKIVENGVNENGINGVEEGNGGEEELEDELKDEEREKLTRVLSGELENLPELGSKIVRIFTSSTFTGMSKFDPYFFFHGEK